MGAVNSSETLVNCFQNAQRHIFIAIAVRNSDPTIILISSHTTTLQGNILSRVGYVTWLITSRRQGCSDYLLYFASTHTQFTISQLLSILCNPVSQLLFNYISANAGLQLSSVATIPRLLSLAVNARLTRSLSKLGFYNLGHCYAFGASNNSFPFIS
jgi:hypothetical protein